MKKVISINEGWIFEKNGEKEEVKLPHTWNNLDGQGGEDTYYMGPCVYTRTLPKYQGKVYIEFGGANSVCSVAINGKTVGVHYGGYSAFRFDITDYLTKTDNELSVTVDNRNTKKVYPETADFTFYGGLYRDVKIIYDVPDVRFSLDDCASKGIYITAKKNGDIYVKSIISGYRTGVSVLYEVCDAQGKLVAIAGDKVKLTVKNPILWNGLKNPYLYQLKASLFENNILIDECSVRFGFREIVFDSEDGCFLNGEHIKLKGVARHQDREALGNALTLKEHREDLQLIKELGANSIRLAHYQQSDDFYSLCDEMGFLVWAEVPVISHFVKKKQKNALSQLEELIKQNMNHPCIFCWGIENEITIRGTSPSLLESINQLNDFAHSLDSSRPTTCAQLSMCPTSSKLNKITDIMGYNHYFGWYTNTYHEIGKWLQKFHEEQPEIKLCLSEYGAEAILGYFSNKPFQGDYSEGYQALFHEEYLKAINANKWLWGSYVWNMFDFGSASRNEGGMRGRNNKGLVTFDRKTRKDSFYLYKAFWSEEKFLHLVGSRYNLRTTGAQSFKVYSNCESVTIKVNGRQKTLKSEKIFNFDGFDIVDGENKVSISSGDLSEKYVFIGVKEYPTEYSVPEGTPSMVHNWFVDKSQTEPDGDCFTVEDKIGDLLKNKDIASMAVGVAGGILKSPLIHIIKPMKVKTVLNMKALGLSDDMKETVIQYLATVKKDSKED